MNPQRRWMLTLAVLVALIALAGTAWADINRTFVYNGADQLVEVKEGTTTVAEHTYDGDGERVRRTAGGQEVVYVRDPDGNVLAEYDGSGDLIAEYVYLNGQKVARIAAGGATTYYHNDHLGTPRAITDASGQVTWHGDNLPFGEEYTSTGARSDAYTFTGHEHDAPIELIYAHARYYDPEVGRFITTDPVGGDPSNPQSWNRYSYVRNNPVGMVDPTGESFWDVVDPVFFAVSVGNLWKKALTGQQITAADNLQVAGDAVGMLPLVPAIGTAGRLAKEGVEHGADVLKAADNLSDAAGRARRLPFADSERLTEVNRTLDRIEAGGPFPHGKDGSVFRNRDGRLPEGNYREYTVETPGATDRGTRRVVVDVDSGRSYYTDDHYQNFVQIDPNRY